MERYEGFAYAADNTALLYRETHWLYREGNVGKRLVLYRCADGTPFARKSITEFPSPWAPSFDFYDARLGYREGVSNEDGHRVAYYQTRKDAGPQRRQLELDGNDVIDAGFDAYVRAHWDQISPSVSLHAAIVVPGRLTTLPVTITEEDLGDPEVRHLRMRLNTWFRLIVPTISIDYERNGRRLAAFHGIGTIRDASGRNLNVHIRFPSDQRTTSIAPEELTAAQHVPLSTQCHP